MRYALPQTVKDKLSARASRLHHLLWHTVRNNWHNFTDEQKNIFQNNHPNWVPKNPRFIREDSGLVRANNNAGEAFLYMHRRMIESVNEQLAAINEPPIVPWSRIPMPDDADYPVPGRNTAPDKLDSFYQELHKREEQLLDHDHLRSNSLARIGTFIESSVHDALHRRWAEVSSGAMKDFPVLDPQNLNPVIDASFDSPTADWLGHPYSSHVNSDFWKLHGWCDQIIEEWRIANDLQDIAWTDTWMGDASHHADAVASPLNNLMVGMSHQHEKHQREKHEHEKHEHGGHSDHELLKVFKTLNSFKDCHIGFDYLEINKIPLPTLEAPRGKGVDSQGK